MLFVSITTLKKSDEAIKYADGIEIRLDFLDKIDLSELKIFMEDLALPVILTIRKKSQGGFYPGTEDQRLKLIAELFSLNPHFIDLEWDIDKEFLESMVNRFPSVKVLCSYHNFEETPSNLEEKFQEIKNPLFYAYKFATISHSSIDGIRMLLFVKSKAGQGVNIIGHCMGEIGQFTRILGPVFGGMLTYASIGKQFIAPGQLDAHELCSLYRHKTLNSGTRIYGLIGSDISESFGHLVHNSAMAALHLNAVYVKIAIQLNELEAFFSFFKEFGLSGLSVTMPLKQHVIKFLDEMSNEAEEIGAVNTIEVSKGMIVGSNTDGNGALDAIEKLILVMDKKVVILGAGGSAKAIAYIAKKRGAKVLILNRNVTSAKELASQVNGKWAPLEEMSNQCKIGYDVLVNCTPNPLPIDPDFIDPRAIIMDIRTNSSNQQFINEAKKRKALVVYGLEMFINQAIGQQMIWFKERVDKKILTESISSAIDGRFRHL